METLHITLVQTDIAWHDAEKNTRMLEEKFHQNIGQTDLIVLPETFNTGFSMEPHLLAEPMDGHTVRWMRKISSHYQCVVTGSLMIKENDKYYNRLIWMRPDGSCETYDKRHLFRLSEEFKYFEHGSQRTIVTLKGWKICLHVCYDLRFPVWSRNHYDQGLYEYDLLLYVASWANSRQVVWRTLLPARAIENQVMVVGVNRVGTDGHGHAHAGASLIASPYGDLIEMIPENQEMIKTIALSPQKLLQLRSSFKVAEDWDAFSLK